MRAHRTSRRYLLRGGFGGPLLLLGLEIAAKGREFFGSRLSGVLAAYVVHYEFDVLFHAASFC